MKPVVVSGMYGLGDNVFQRAFVKTLTSTREVFLTTSWPELYEDLGVEFIRPATKLRTQAKNIDRSWVKWRNPPGSADHIKVSYGSHSLRSGSIVQAMEVAFKVAPSLSWDLPAFPRTVRHRPIALVRPVTERMEWHNSARGPLPEYVAQIADDLMSTHHVISVADLVRGQEWALPPEPPAHERFHAGELDVKNLLGLVQSADVVVGGVGWIVPASIAAGVNLFCVLGGQGGHNAPEKITDPRMDLSHAYFAQPDRYCRCENMRHGCNKRITGLDAKWARWRREHLHQQPPPITADVAPGPGNWLPAGAGVPV